MPVLFSKCNFLPEIMLVSTGAVHDLAKYALLYHIEYHHFASSKTAVFQKHKRCLCLFIGFYQIPALIQCIGSPYFHRNCFPRIQAAIAISTWLSHADAMITVFTSSSRITSSASVYT